MMEKKLKTEILRLDMTQELAGQPAIRRAAELLRRGELVAFPTETVYGLGGNAYLPATAADIYAAKGRPSDNPLIVHVAEIAQIPEFAELTAEAELLLRAFSPGPLTVVLNKKPNLPDTVTGGLNTVAVRIPSHPAARALLAACDLPVAAPSANLSGKPSPTTGEHVFQDLQGRIALVLDGGPAGVGLESTVLDLTVQPPVILRPGAVTLEQLRAYIPAVVPGGAVLPEGVAPKAPGMKYRHYAPNGSVEIFPAPELAAAYRAAADPDIVLLATADVLRECQPCRSYELAASATDVETASRRLFAALRYCDQLGAARIFAQSFPAAGLGSAYMNRLQKAAAAE